MLTRCQGNAEYRFLNCRFIVFLVDYRKDMFSQPCPRIISCYPKKLLIQVYKTGFNSKGEIFKNKELHHGKNKLPGLLLLPHLGRAHRPHRRPASPSPARRLRLDSLSRYRSRKLQSRLTGYSHNSHRRPSDGHSTDNSLCSVTLYISLVSCSVPLPISTLLSLMLLTKPECENRGTFCRARRRSQLASLSLSLSLSSYEKRLSSSE